MTKLSAGSSNNSLGLRLLPVVDTLDKHQNTRSTNKHDVADTHPTAATHYSLSCATAVQTAPKCAGLKMTLIPTTG